MYNMWNSWSELNQDAYFLTNLMLNDKIKKISILKTCQGKKIAIKKQGLNLIGNKKLKKRMILKEIFNFIKYSK